LRIGIMALALLAPNVLHAEEAADSMVRDLTIGQRPIWDFTQQQAAAAANWPPAQRLDVDAWVDHHDQTYRLGQPLTVSVRPHVNAYITVLNYGTSGRMTMVFPNQFQQDNRVPAGRIVQVPPNGAPFHLASAGPAGVEVLQVVASDHPLSLPEVARLGAQQGESPFVSLGRSAADVTRDLVLEMKPQPTGTPDSHVPVSKIVMVRVLPTGVVGVAPAYPPSVTPGYPSVPPAYPSVPVNGLQPPVGGPIPAFGAELPLIVRTDKNVYHTGEPVQVTVVARQPCPLTLLTSGPSGVVSQLYPNAQQPPAILMPGQVLMVPPPNSGLQVVAGAPAGIETIVGVCSHGDASSETAFQQVLTQRSAQATPRDLALVAARPDAVDGQAAAAYFVTQ
jgi:hypothetical protein